MPQFLVEVSHLLRVRTRFVVGAPNKEEAQAALPTLYRSPEVDEHINNQGEFDPDWCEEGTHQVLREYQPTEEAAQPLARIKPLNGGGRVIVYTQEKQ